MPSGWSRFCVHERPISTVAQSRAAYSDNAGPWFGGAERAAGLPVNAALPPVRPKFWFSVHAPVKCRLMGPTHFLAPETVATVVVVRARPHPDHVVIRSDFRAHVLT